MRSRWPKLLAGIALIALAVAAAEDFVPHTDDGCPVEVHCVVCSAHLGHIAITAPANLPSLVSQAVLFIHAETPRSPHRVARNEKPPRAPPIL
jgi:hypothetical protein